MPGAVTHLKAAYLYKNTIGNIDNEPLFYLGAICPDSVNINGHAKKELRWPAHLRDADLTVWEQRVADFYRKNKNRYDNSYLLGYVIHIITDIVWDREFDLPLFAVMHKNGVPKEELKSYRWREIDGYEAKQQGKEWINYVYSCLNTAVAEDIGTLLATDVDGWKNAVLQKEYDTTVFSNYIGEDFMNEFFTSVVQNMLKITQDN